MILLVASFLWTTHTTSSYKWYSFFGSTAAAGLLFVRIICFGVLLQSRRKKNVTMIDDSEENLMAPLSPKRKKEKPYLNSSLV